MPPQTKKKAATPARGRDAGAMWAAGALAASLAASALLVDPRAEASFDAPKRLAALLAIVVAGGGAFLLGSGGNSLADLWRRAGRLPRAAVVLLATALAGTLAAAWLSPRRTMSLDAERVLLLFALLLPLGASRVVERNGRRFLGLYLGLSALNAGVSLLERLRIFRPFAVEVSGPRDATGAFVGNVGYLALAIALAAVSTLAVAFDARRPLPRALGAALLPLFLAALLVNQNLTALTALAAGGTALIFAKLGKRAILPVAVLLAVLLVGLWTFPSTQARATGALAAARRGDWDLLLTYRLGPWSAAIEMVGERPLLGFGPGTFAAEFVPHRLKAEILSRRRLINPLVTSSYSEAHSEPLQALAEGGVAGLAGLAAAAAVLLALWRVARGRGAAATEAALLFAILVAGAVAALTWFPLQRPVSSIPLLLAAGRGWRLVAEAGRPEEV
jgi:O-antigen ligase